jgi:hypothetical protein
MLLSAGPQGISYAIIPHFLDIIIFIFLAISKSPNMNHSSSKVHNQNPHQKSSLIFISSNIK